MLILLLLMSIGAFSLRFQKIQNFVLPYVTEFVSELIGTQVEIKRVDIELFDKVVLEGVIIRDQQQQPMIVSQKLKIGLIYFPVLEWLSSRSKTKKIAARLVELENPELHLYLSRETCELNLDFLTKGGKPKPPDKTTPKPIEIDVKNLIVKGMQFSYIDSTKHDTLLLPIAGRMNYRHIRVKKADLDARFYLKTGQKMVAEIRHFFAQEHSGLQIDTFQTVFTVRFQAAPHPQPQPYLLPDGSEPVPNITLENTILKIGKTRLDFDGRIENEQLATLFTGENPKDYRVQFRKSIFDFEVLQYFSEDIPFMSGIAQIEGPVTASLNKIKGKNVKIRYNQNTWFRGDFELRDFIDDETLYMRFRLQDTQIETADAAKLLRFLSLPDFLNQIGLVKVNGKFSGFLTDFVTDGNFETPIGNVKANLNFKISKETKKVTYDGDLI
ncbi:MAG: hypothetical protein NZ108_06370, partial [Bacteroidia bacterium]|nr:hypothetical protein [Bacteroidia bacterium]